MKSTLKEIGKMKRKLKEWKRKETQVYKQREREGESGTGETWLKNTEERNPNKQKWDEKIGK